MLWGLKKTTLVLAFALILLISLSNATCKTNGATCSAGSECCSGACGGTCKNWYDDIYIWTAFSVLIASAFLGLAYMAARLFELSVLDAWVKIELQELMASIVIAVFCVALIAGVNAASQFLVEEKGGSTDVTGAARGFLRDTVFADGQELYLTLTKAYFNIAKVASYSYTAGQSFGGIISVSYSASPGSGLSPLLGEIGQAMDAVANMMLLTASQSAFLLFFQSAATIMLPVGIFLRSFSLTRKVGGVVLAAVIASAVIYPAAVMVSKEVYGTYHQDLRTTLNGINNIEPAPDPPLAGAICNPYMQTFVLSPLPFIGGELGWYVLICIPLCALIGCHGICYKVIEVTFIIIKSFFPILMLIPLLNYASRVGDFNIAYSSYYQPLQDFALPAVVKYSVLSLTVFLIPLIITIVLLRNITILFGGEPQLYGLSKLV